MKRDRRLQGLSAEHHHALVLARHMARLAAGAAVDAGDAAAVGARFDRELEPHFRVEEELLLPALRAAGDEALVARTEVDHAALREAMAAARAGDAAAMRAFAARLEEHVRFEERELFPRCEERLPDATLDAVARRAPPRR